MFCTGDFIDDYAVDEIERYDRSFIFVVETDGQSVLRLLLYPTVIQDFQARCAKNAERQAIVANMQRLCTKLKTATTWDEKKECLEVWLNQHS